MMMRGLIFCSSWMIQRAGLKHFFLPGRRFSTSPAGQDPDKATGPYLDTATVTLSSPRKSTPFCDEN
jgi:hypothetical protein